MSSTPLMADLNTFKDEPEIEADKTKHKMRENLLVPESLDELNEGTTDLYSDSEQFSKLKIGSEWVDKNEYIPSDADTEVVYIIVDVSDSTVFFTINYNEFPPLQNRFTPVKYVI